MFRHCRNSKEQGDVGVGAAIAWFTANGYTVSVPLSDSQDYDLIVDAVGPERVQVKTSGRKLRSGGYAVTVAVRGGNRSWKGTIKPINPGRVEKVFILIADGRRYLIPVREMGGIMEVTVGGKKYSEYEVK